MGIDQNSNTSATTPSIALGSVNKFLAWCLTNNLNVLLVNLSGNPIGLPFSNFNQVNSPNLADILIVAGAVTEKMGHKLLHLYDQMPNPKWVVAWGSDAISGGLFFYDSYSVLRGVDTIIGVDIYIPGNPPSQETIADGLSTLKKIIIETTASRKQSSNEVDPAQFSENAKQTSVDRVKTLHGDNWEPNLHLDLQKELHETRIQAALLEEIARKEQQEAEIRETENNLSEADLPEDTQSKENLIALETLEEEQPEDILNVTEPTEPTSSPVDVEEETVVLHLPKENAENSGEINDK